MTPSLRDLQRAFAAGVFDASSAVLAHVRDGMFPAARHLQVYRNNTFANLTDALAACYPVVSKLVGDGFFNFAANEYTRAHPPHSGNLHDFGASLPQFLARFAPAQSLPYLPDMARLEWMWQQAYHAADAELSRKALAAVPAKRYPGLVLQLHPSARLFMSPYPCLRIWQVNQPDFDGDATVSLDEGAQALLVIRRRLDVVIEPLPPGDYAMLQACAQSRPLSQARTAALAQQRDFDLGASLRRHVAAGTITGFTDSLSQQ